MSTRAHCTFTVQGWDEQTFSEAEGGLKLTHTTMARTFQGDLEGQGTLRYLMFYGPDQQTRVLGIERVTGKLGGKSGTFVLEHIGGDDGREARGKVTILSGSGTGDLAGISGTGESLATRAGKLTVTLTYELA